MGRKTPVRHVVHNFVRETDQGPVPVRTHVRGHGTKGSAPKIPTPAYLKGTSISDNTITERDLLLIKNRLNANRIKISDVKIPDDGWKLGYDQTKKGYDFLMSLWKTPTGQERKNNPFGYREQDALENFKEFRVIDFYDAANYYQNKMGIHFYQPYYRVVGKDNDFEYAYYGGEIHIMG